MAQSQTVHEAILAIRADSAQLRSDLAKSRSVLQSGLGELQGMMTRAAGVFGIGLGAGAAAKAILSLAKGAADYADSIGKAAQVTGTSTEALSAWRHGADLAGVSTEELETALTRYSRQIADATAGNKTAQSTFDSLGISIRNPAGEIKTTEALLGDLAERFQRMPDGAQKTNAAMELLGRSGARLIPLLNGGRENIKAFTDEAQRMGLIVSGDAARAAEQFNDNLTRLSKSVEGLKLSIGNNLIPAAIRLLDIFGKLGGVKLEGLETRALESSIALIDKQVAALQQKLGKLAGPAAALPGERGGFDPSARDRMAISAQIEALAAERKDLADELRRLNDDLVKPKGGGTQPIIVDTAALKKSESEIRSFFDGLQKQVEQTRGKLKEGLFGEGSALGDQLDTEFKRLKDNLAAANLPVPAGLAARFDLLKRSVMGANQELRTQKLLLEQSGGGLDAIDADEGKDRDAAIEKTRELGRAIIEAGKAWETFRIEQHGAMTDLDSQEWGRFQEEVESMILAPRRNAAVEGLQQTFGGITDAISTGFADTLRGINEGSQSLSDGLNNAARNILLSVNAAAFDALVLAPLKSIANEFFAGFAEAFAEAGDSAAEKIAKDLGRSFGGWLREVFSDLNLGGGSGFSFDFTGILKGIGSFFGFEKGGLVPAFANGGPVGNLAHFDGGGLAVLHPNEYVIRAPSARTIGAGNLDYINRTGELPQTGGGAMVAAPEVHIHGDIIPRRPEMRREDVIKIVVGNMKDKGAIYSGLAEYGPKK